MVCENCGRILVDTDLFDAVEVEIRILISFLSPFHQRAFFCIKSSGRLRPYVCCSLLFTNLPVR